MLGSLGMSSLLLFQMVIVTLFLLWVIHLIRELLRLIRQKYIIWWLLLL